MSARWPSSARTAARKRASSCSTSTRRRAPCRALEPRLEAFARRHAGQLRVLQVDVDEHLATAQDFGVQSLPTLIIFSDGTHGRGAV